MEVILMAMGTKGDIHPIVGLAKELKQRKFSPTIITNEVFKEIIIDAGINFHAIGSRPQYFQGNSTEVWRYEGNTGDNFVYYHLPAFESAFKFVKSRYLENPNLLIVSLCKNNGARAAADILNIPCVTITLSPSLIFSSIAPSPTSLWRLPKWLPKLLHRPFLIYRYTRTKNIFYTKKITNDFKSVRKSLNALPIGKNNLTNEILHLGFFPEWFGQRPKDWPKEINLVGFPLFDTVMDKSREIISEFVTKNGMPIVFTTGTGVTDIEDFIQEGIEICKMLQLPGLFVGGDKQDLSHYGDEYLHLSYVDFEYALPKCKAIIHHGGMGTLAQAIKAGIPQLIRPLKFDQPDNADRIYRLGLGSYIFPDLFKPHYVAPRLASLINSETLKKTISTYSADVERSNAIAYACGMIETKLAERSMRNHAN